jgi:5-methylcytosine-specific restriction endonuclease McrA
MRKATIGVVNFDDVLMRDGAVCHICNCTVPLNEIEYDHVIPLARGGEHSNDNLRVAHRLCNIRKGAKILDGGYSYQH